MSGQRPAIAPEYVGELLEPFRRGSADRTNNDVEGRGVGVSTVAAIADTHQADLRIRARAEGDWKSRWTSPHPRNATPVPAPAART